MQMSREEALAALTRVSLEAVEHERAARAIRRREIPELATFLLNRGVTMANVGAAIKTLHKTEDVVKSTTRQHVEQIVMAHEGRERPRREEQAA